MGQLTSHVLDVAAGVPAAQVRIELHQWVGTEYVLRDTVVTNHDGRCAVPLLSGDKFIVGRYSLTFHTGDYFRSRGVALSEPAFIDQAVIRIGIAHAEQDYHVPLLISPWSYSVYRGG